MNKTKFYIVPDIKTHYDIVDAVSREDALIQFAYQMNTDISAYFDAVEEEPVYYPHGYTYPEGNFETALAIIMAAITNDTVSEYYIDGALDDLNIAQMAIVGDLQHTYEQLKKANPHAALKSRKYFYKILRKITGFHFDDEKKVEKNKTKLLPAPLTFRLYQSVKFNQPVNPDKDIIVPGGYEIVVKDEDDSEKSIQFDFEWYEGTIDDKDRTIVHCIQKNPDYSVFEDLNLLNEYMLRNIVRVNEWFIYTGEGSVVKPIEILNPELEIIPNDDIPIFRIPVTIQIIPSFND